ncbi:hypothetical protein DL93DRAFT_2085574 [Clavulina sp. PMI_390]|nr:hypothetical protein DL93DRAFT_2085574 [Clavulina sp. PMI_390]
MTEIKKLPASRQPLENPHIIELFRELGFLLPEHATLALEGGLLESLVHIINGSNLSWSRYAMSNIIAIVSTMGTSCHARLINAGAPQALLEAACILIDSESRPWPQTSVEPLFVVSIALSAVILMSGSDKTSSMKETLRGLQALTRLLVIARHNMKSCPPVAALALTAALPLITMQDGQMADELLGISVDILAGIENWRVIVHYNTEDRTRSQELERFLSPEATRNGLILALAIYAENGSWACRQVASPPLLNAIARIIRFRTSPNTTESLYRAVDILHSIASDDADPNFVRSFLQANIPSVLVDLLASGPSRAPLELDDGRRLPSIIPKIMGTLSNLCDTGIPAQEAIAAEDDTGLNVMLSILRSPKFNSREHFMALHILFSFVAQVDSPDRRCGHRLARAGCIEVFKDILEREDASPTVRAMTVKATYRCMAATQTENTVIRRFIESGIVPLVIGHIRNPDSVHQLLAAGAGCVGEFARCGELGIRSVLDANAFDALALVLNRRDTDPDARRCALLGIRMTSNLNAKLFIACASSEVVPALQKHLAEPRLYDGCGPNHIPIAKELLQQLLTARRLLQRHGPGFVAAVMHKLKEAAR